MVDAKSGTRSGFGARVGGVAERLESRFLLAVTPAEYDALRSTYPGFGLPADSSTINIIEIAPADLSVASLKAAIASASASTLPDLIIARTTASQNTITYAAASDSLSLDIPSTSGTTTLVSLGSKPLMLDAAGMANVLSIGTPGSTTGVNLGGLVLTGGDGWRGGGIYLRGGSLNLSHLTIAQNISSWFGGGIGVDGGTLAMDHAIVARNTGVNGPDISVRAGTLSGSDNLVGDGSGQTSLVHGASGNLIGSSGNPIDPLLAEGVVTSLAPLPDSPAINAAGQVTIGAAQFVLSPKIPVVYVVNSLENSIAADGKLTLAEALAAANSNTAVGDAPAGSYSSPDEIQFAPGLSGTIQVWGLPCTIRGSLKLVGPGTNLLTLDGMNSTGVLAVKGAYPVEISGITVTGGKAANGGGIAAYGAQLLLHDMAITNSYSGGGGGGLFQFSGSLAMTRVEVNGNFARNGGGGIRIDNGAANLADLTITANRTEGDGGGISQTGQVSALSSLTITRNSAINGGGISQTGGVSTLTHLTVSDNTASTNGGGIGLFSQTATVSDSTISANAADQGGAICGIYGDVTIARSTIQGNGVRWTGGGVYLSNLTAALANLVVSNNSSLSGAGGIFVTGGSASLTNLTVVGNSAQSGGGLYLSSGELTLSNTILAQNAANQGADVFLYAGSLTGSHNLIGDGSGQYVPVDGLDGNRIGIAADPLDPQFVSTASTNKNLWDLRLQPTSPAVDAGSNTLIPAGTTQDLDGRPRIINGTVEIGAYELDRVPTDLALSSTWIAEQQPAGSVVATLGTADPDAGDTFSYALVDGDGSADNSQFIIDGSMLKAAATFDLQGRSSYSVRIRTTDASGQSFEKAFTLTVSTAPTDILLTSAGVDENQPAGTAAGTLSTADANSGDAFTYTLVDGEGATDNALFTLDGDQLRTAGSFDSESRNSYSIRICSTDRSGLSVEKVFTIGVHDLPEFGLQQGKLQRATLTDTDGDLVTFSLTGGGSGTIQSDGRITLTGTTAKSVLSISVKRAKAGDGYYALPGIASEGLLKSLTASRIFANGPIALNTATAAAGLPTTISLAGVIDGSLDTHGQPIASFKLQRWQNTDATPDQLLAPWIGMISASGDWEADILTSSSNRGIALGSFKLGSLRDSTIWAAGTLKSLAARGGIGGSRIAAADGLVSLSASVLYDSDILVGVSRDFTGHSATSFANPAARLGKLAITGQKLPRGLTHPAYVGNSHISAGSYGTITLTNVPATITTPILHVAADTGTLKLITRSPDMLPAGTWKATQPPKPGHERPNLVEVVA